MLYILDKVTTTIAKFARKEITSEGLRVSIEIRN
jgi:hypothetical protein